MKKMVLAYLFAMLTLGVLKDANADATPDGLVETGESAFKHAWVKPGVDFSQYNKIMLAPAEFDFREVRKQPNMFRTRSNQSEFYIEDKDRERIIETVTGIFDEQLSNVSGFEFVTEPGDDVLILQGGLMDIVSNTPPPMIGAGESYVSSFGAATLVIQALDSTTGEVVFRAAERKRIERPGRELVEANPVTSMAEVRRWAKRWARRLTQDLDSVHA